jgi:hypothetical protein
MPPSEIEDEMRPNGAPRALFQTLASDSGGYIIGQITIPPSNDRSYGAISTWEMSMDTLKRPSAKDAV